MKASLYAALRCFLVVVVAFAGYPSAAEWKEQVLYSFQGGPGDGFDPAGGVVFDKAGNLYGATTGGGSGCTPIGGECGLVFMLSPPAKKGDPWTETILYEFKGEVFKDASVPAGGVILDAAGNVYGTTAYGGTGGCILLGITAGCGTVYELSPPIKQGDPWTETILYSLQGGNDGYFPWGTLTFDSKGNLYGATQFGGGKGNTCNPFFGGNCGTVFDLSPPKQKGEAWAEQVLRSFGDGKDGGSPNGGLLIGKTRVIYGTTYFGGGSQNCPSNTSTGCGTVFRLSPPKTKEGKWTETVLHAFNSGNDGALPNGGLIFSTRGGLLGSTTYGGTGLSGIVFRLNPDKHGSWNLTTLYDFTGRQDGFAPTPVIPDRMGNLYGAAFGGAKFGGVVFRLEHLPGQVKFTLLHNFSGAPDGAHPEAPLIFDNDHDLYGTTIGGGTGNACDGGCGTVFKMSP